MQYLIFRGEYPFNDVIGMASGPKDEPEKALQDAKNQFKHDPDFFKRHPVVEPVGLQ